MGSSTSSTCARVDFEESNIKQVGQIFSHNGYGGLLNWGYWAGYDGHCTGFLVGPGMYIVTAAHCFEGYDWAEANAGHKGPKFERATNLIFCPGWNKAKKKGISSDEAKAAGCVPITKYWVFDGWTSYNLMTRADHFHANAMPAPTSPNPSVAIADWNGIENIDRSYIATWNKVMIELSQYDVAIGLVGLHPKKKNRIYIRCS